MPPPIVNPSRDVRILIPFDTGRLLCARAEERWKNRAISVAGGKRSLVHVWPPNGTRIGRGVSPIGSFTIEWGTPSPCQALITQLEWDAAGGAEEAIRYA